MTLVRWGFLVALAVSVCGCEVGAPGRASDIQNLNGISDDIASVTMTQSDSSRVHDPNLPSMLPTSYTTEFTP